VEASQQQQQHVRVGHAGDGDYVEFFRADTVATGAFQCVSCQEVQMARGVLGACANCGERLWEAAEWSPFRHAS
jgi:hypothetical protein